MADAITWKNIAAPDLSTVVKANESAGNLAARAFEGLSNMGSTFEEAQKTRLAKLAKEQTDSAVLQVNSIGSMEEFNALKNSGVFSIDNINQSMPNVDKGMLGKALAQKEQSLLEGMAKQQDITKSQMQIDALKRAEAEAIQADAIKAIETEVSSSFGTGSVITEEEYFKGQEPTPTQRAAFQRAKISGQQMNIQAKEAQASLNDLALEGDLANAVSASVMKGDFSTARQTILESNLSDTAKEQKLRLLDDSQANYDQRIYVGKLKEADKGYSDIAYKYLSGSVSAEDVKAELTDYYSGMGISPEDTQKKMADLESFVASVDKMTTEQKADFDTTAGLIKNTYDTETALFQGQIAKADETLSQLQIPVPDNVDAANAESVDSAFSSEYLKSVAEAESKDANQIMDEFGDLVRADDTLKGVPNWMVVRAVKEYGQVYNNPDLREGTVFSLYNIAEEAAAKVIKDGLKNMYLQYLKEQPLREKAKADKEAAMQNMMELDEEYISVQGALLKTTTGTDRGKKLSQAVIDNFRETRGRSGITAASNALYRQ